MWFIKKSWQQTFTYFIQIIYIKQNNKKKDEHIGLLLNGYKGKAPRTDKY